MSVLVTGQEPTVVFKVDVLHARFWLESLGDAAVEPISAKAATSLETENIMHVFSLAMKCLLHKLKE